jgi:transcriptional regulator with XRE-family HTH domain
MTTGEKIKKRRLELGITQKDVARMIGTTNAYVSAIEKQKRDVKKETRLIKFAKALECSVDDLRSDAPKGMVEPTSDDFGAICNCAVRYCLGRRSYMPSLVCGYITPLLPELTDKTLDCFERDIAERKRTGFDFGDSCDYETWDAFYKAVCKEIERRKGNESQTD